MTSAARAAEIHAHDSKAEVINRQAAFGLPPLEYRARLLLDFIELHVYTAHWALFYAIHQLCKDSEIDSSHQLPMMDVFLEYRKDCDGDPSRAFIINHAEVYTAELERPNPAVHGVTTVIANLVKVSNVLACPENVRWCIEDPDAVHVETSTVWDPWHPPAVPSILQDVDWHGNEWLEGFRRFVEDGWTFREQRVGLPMGLGQLVKSRSGWAWRSIEALARAKIRRAHRTRKAR